MWAGPCPLRPVPGPGPRPRPELGCSQWGRCGGRGRPTVRRPFLTPRGTDPTPGWGLPADGPGPLPAADTHPCAALQAGPQRTAVLGASLCPGPGPQIQVAEQDPAGAELLRHGLLGLQGCPRACGRDQVSRGPCRAGQPLLCCPLPVGPRAGGSACLPGAAGRQARSPGRSDHLLGAGGRSAPASGRGGGGAGAEPAPPELGHLWHFLRLRVSDPLRDSSSLWAVPGWDPQSPGGSCHVDPDLLLPPRTASPFLTVRLGWCGFWPVPGLGIELATLALWGDAAPVPRPGPTSRQCVQRPLPSCRPRLQGPWVGGRVCPAVLRVGCSCPARPRRSRSWEAPSPSPALSPQPGPEGGGRGVAGLEGPPALARATAQTPQTQSSSRGLVP